MSSSIACCAWSGGEAHAAQRLAMAPRNRLACSVTIVTGTMAAVVGLGTILAAATLVWMISVRLRDASIADIFWGFGFVVLACLYCVLSPTLTPRSWLVAVLITLWGAR